MAFFKSSNPAMQDKAFEGTTFPGMTNTQAMTVNGTLNRFGFMFLMMMGSCFFAWTQFYKGSNPMPLLLTGVFGGLVVAMIIVFKKQWAPYLAPAYALLEGLFVGSVSAYYDYAFKTSYPGLVMQAVGLTLVVALVMFLIYRFRIIRVTEKFRMIIIIATISVAAFYFIQLIASLFGANIAAFTNAATPLGIGFSIFVVALASLNLLLDFDMIEKGVQMQAPKFMEWYCAFGLMVTLVWLYLEILRLLSKLNRR
ncbi:MAG: Bax inhibitor-1/YccA family protein [Bacteroidetes bacterium]|nr:Bax inhibitor-1/YccA family protein [Bacteroidota bacterium]MBS1632459.1 Bax inhibitor-1/YccA family protein [Bacteroidota bacterium]